MALKPRRSDVGLLDTTVNMNELYHSLREQGGALYENFHLQATVSEMHTRSKS